RTRRCLRADRGVAAGTVFDQDGLAPILAHALADEARDRVRRAARRERHNDADRAVRIAFCVRLERCLRQRGTERQREGDSSEEGARRRLHGEYQSSFIPTAWIPLARVSAWPRSAAPYPPAS